MAAIAGSTCWERQGDDGEDHSADDADGEGEPEDIVVAVEEEGDEAQHGADNGEHCGHNLAVEGLEVRAQPWAAADGAHGVELGREVDARVHHNAAEHHHCRVAALVEGDAENGVHQEQSDETNGYHQNDDERLLERLEQRRANHQNDGHHAEEQSRLLAFLSAAPVVTVARLGAEAHREGFVEAVNLFLNQFRAQLP